MYYSNHATLFQLVSSIIVEKNLGTGLPKPKCIVCEKAVR